MEDYSSHVSSSTKSLTLWGMTAEGHLVVVCVGKLQLHLHVETGDTDQKIQNVFSYLQYWLPYVELRMLVM